MKPLRFALLGCLLLTVAGAASAQTPSVLLVVETEGTLEISIGPGAPPALMDFETTSVLYRDQAIFGTSKTTSPDNTFLTRGQATAENYQILLEQLNAGRIGQRGITCVAGDEPPGDGGQVASVVVTWFGRNERRAQMRLLGSQPDGAAFPACPQPVLQLIEDINAYQESVDDENIETVSTRRI